MLWDGQPRDVVAYVSDTAPLVGMPLLDSHSLYLEVENARILVFQVPDEFLQDPSLVRIAHAVVLVASDCNRQDADPREMVQRNVSEAALVNLDRV